MENKGRLRYALGLEPLYSELQMENESQWHGKDSGELLKEKDSDGVNIVMG